MTICRLSALMLSICGILIVAQMLIQCGDRETPNKQEKTLAYSSNETDSDSEEDLDELDVRHSLMDSAIEDAMQTIKMLFGYIGKRSVAWSTFSYDNVGMEHVYFTNSLPSHCCLGQSVQSIGKELGLSLLDGLLRKSKEKMAYAALKRQIEVYEKVDPQSAALLKNVPTEKMVSIIVDSQENQAPGMGNAFLDILAKNGIVLGAQAPSAAAVSNAAASSSSSQVFPVAQVVQGLVQNLIQSVKPSIVSDPIAGSFFNNEPKGGDPTFPFAVVGLPHQQQKPNAASGGPLSFLSPVFGGVSSEKDDSKQPEKSVVPPDPFGPLIGTEHVNESSLNYDEISGNGTPEDEAESTTSTATTTTTTRTTTKVLTETVTQSQPASFVTMQRPNLYSSPAPTHRDRTVSRLTELNQRAIQLLSIKSPKRNGEQKERQTTAPLRPPPTIRKEADVSTKAIDPSQPSIHNIMLSNTWQSLREPEPRRSTNKIDEIMTNEFQPRLSGPLFSWLNVQSREQPDHVLFKASTNVADYRQSSLAMQLPSGQSASIGDHGFHDTRLRGAVHLPKRWMNDATVMEPPRNNAFVNTAGRSIRPIFSRGFSLPNNDGRYQGGLLFGRTDTVPEPPADAFYPATGFGGNFNSLIPKGLYYKRKHKSSIEGSLSTPNFQKPATLLSRFGAVNGAVKEADNVLTGLYVPMPLGLQPVSFQMIDEDADVKAEGVNLGVKQLRQPLDQEENERNNEVVSLLRTVQSSILAGGNPLDRLRQSVGAGDFFQRLFGQLMPPLLQSAKRKEKRQQAPMDTQKALQTIVQLLQREDEAKRLVDSLRDGNFAGRLATNVLKRLANQLLFRPKESNESSKPSVVDAELKNNKERSVGIVMSVPGIDPMYLGGFLDKLRSDNKPS
ncbi:hypothetical protein TTRE_0000702801 [Trichuris trichiura]|uniref:Uncharacterized protein n=1 Tax=Trichuris trichiura TaxID=36087 RepID=A0A077ZGG1_TRITR|nr:hypothetical protein TTRE_0000702801 [Trichuris trichiura]